MKNDPFEEGVHAAAHGESDNPYPVGSNDWEEWEAGWESYALDDTEEDYDNYD